MENNQSFNRGNPLVVAAATSVLVFSLVGIGVFTGVIPNAASNGNGAAVAPVATKSNGATAAHSSARSSNRVLAGNAGASWGTIESIRTVETSGHASGVGMVAGGLGGAVVGNQIGNGNGRAAMTVLGAAGGAYAGNEIEKNLHKQVSYRVTVRMDDGTYRSFSQPTAPGYNAGERVRVENGGIVRAG